MICIFQDSNILDEGAKHFELKKYKGSTYSYSGLCPVKMLQCITLENLDGSFIIVLYAKNSQRKKETKVKFQTLKVTSFNVAA